MLWDGNDSIYSAVEAKVNMIRGMALGAVTNRTPSWWQLAAWSILAVVFVVFAARTTLAGRRNGWDTPIEEIKQP